MTLPYSPSVPLKKRKHTNIIEDSCNKKVALSIVSNVSDDESAVSSVAAAEALVKLSHTPITKWVQHFDETSDSSGDDDEEVAHTRISGEDKIIKALVHATFAARIQNNSTILPVCKPDDYLKTLVLKSTGKHVKYIDAASLKQYFASITEDRIQSYTMEFVKAVRNNDVDTVRRLRDQGYCMNACNKFGDSVVHLACRRKSEQVLEFLLKECRISASLVCDYGRTPLHDACWTVLPNYYMIEMLLDACPALLFIKDARGATALEYLKKESWGSMCRFLEHRSALIPLRTQD